MRLIRECLKQHVMVTLRECKANVRSGATDFNNAMEVAADNGHIEIVRLMLSHGANNFRKATILNRSVPTN